MNIQAMHDAILNNAGWVALAGLSVGLVIFCIFEWRDERRERISEEARHDVREERGKTLALTSTIRKLPRISKAQKKLLVAQALDIARGLREVEKRKLPKPPTPYYGDALGVILGDR